VQQYLRETSRVLKPGGRCLHTAFVLDAAALTAVREGTDGPRLRHEVDGFMTSDLRHMEDAVGIPEDKFQSMYQAAGLEELEIYRGTWAPRTGPTLSYQDILVACKRHVPAANQSARPELEAACL